MSCYIKNTGGIFRKELREENLLFTMATQNKCSSLYLINYIGKHKHFELAFYVTLVVQSQALGLHCHAIVMQ